MTIKSIKIIIQLIIIFIIQIIFVSYVQAAVLSAASSEEGYKVGDIISIDLNLDSQGEYINAMEIKVQYDSSHLELDDFSKGNSIINYWIVDPRLDNSGKLDFTGGIPNGFEGKAGLLAKLIFKAIVSGETEIKILSDSRVLLNDGQGSPAKLSIGNLKIIISEKIAGQNQDEWQSIINLDKISPEPFKIYLNHSDKLFGGQYFVAFSTNDKQTGVDYYEIKEGNGVWQKSSSPYLLRDQSLNKKIAVRAVDKAGNERVEILIRDNAESWLSRGWPIVSLLLAIMVLSCYFLIRQSRLKK